MQEVAKEFAIPDYQLGLNVSGDGQRGKIHTTQIGACRLIRNCDHHDSMIEASTSGQNVLYFGNKIGGAYYIWSLPHLSYGLGDFEAWIEGILLMKNLLKHLLYQLGLNVSDDGQGGRTIHTTQIGIYRLSRNCGSDPNTSKKVTWIKDSSTLHNILKKKRPMIKQGSRMYWNS
ncbi:hypothetical protein ACET3Z_025560 [Daucus carota]